MKLVDRCLQSEALKRKLQGLNELKDIVKSVTYGSERNKSIVILLLFRKPGSRKKNCSKKYIWSTATFNLSKNLKSFSGISSMNPYCKSTICRDYIKLPRKETTKAEYHCTSCSKKCLISSKNLMWTSSSIVFYNLIFLSFSMKISTFSIKWASFLTTSPKTKLEASSKASFWDKSSMKVSTNTPPKNTLKS